MSDSNDQYKFGDDGELEEPDDDEDDEEQLNDQGEEMPWYETRGGYRRDVMSSLFQKSARRSDEQTTAWAAWELARSGCEAHFWKRAVLVTLEDLKAGNEAVEKVLRYEDLAKNRWPDSEWHRRLCVIAAALVCTRAHSSRETTHANGYFDCAAKDRVQAQREDDHEPLYEPPVTDEELDPDGRVGFLAADKHTYPGSGKGRDWTHFRIHGARIGPEDDTELGETLRRRILQYEEYGYREHQIEFSEEQIEHAVEPTPEDDPWRCEFDEDTDLDEFDSVD